MGSLSKIVKSLSVLTPTHDRDRTIHLRGTGDVLASSFGLVFCRILKARKFYPESTFATSSKFGVIVDVPNESDLVLYVTQVTKKVKDWLTVGGFMLQVVVSSALGEKEIWQFELAINEYADKKHVLEECIQNVDEMCQEMPHLRSDDISISLKAVKTEASHSPNPGNSATVTPKSMQDWFKVYFSYKVDVVFGTSRKVNGADPPTLFLTSLESPEKEIELFNVPPKPGVCSTLLSTQSCLNFSAGMKLSTNAPQGVAVLIEGMDITDFNRGVTIHFSANVWLGKATFGFGEKEGNSEFERQTHEKPLCPTRSTEPKVFRPSAAKQARRLELPAIRASKEVAPVVNKIEAWCKSILGHFVHIELRGSRTIAFAQTSLDAENAAATLQRHTRRILIPNIMDRHRASAFIGMRILVSVKRRLFLRIFTVTRTNAIVLSAFVRRALAAPFRAQAHASTEKEDAARELLRVLLRTCIRNVFIRLQVLRNGQASVIASQIRRQLATRRHSNPIILALTVASCFRRRVAMRRYFARINLAMTISPHLRRRLMGGRFRDLSDLAQVVQPHARRFLSNSKYREQLSASWKMLREPKEDEVAAANVIWVHLKRKLSRRSPVLIKLIELFIRDLNLKPAVRKLWGYFVSKRIANADLIPKLRSGLCIAAFVKRKLVAHDPIVSRVSRLSAIEAFQTPAQIDAASTLHPAIQLYAAGKLDMPKRGRLPDCDQKRVLKRIIAKEDFEAQRRVLGGLIYSRLEGNVQRFSYLIVVMSGRTLAAAVTQLVRRHQFYFALREMRGKARSHRREMIDLLACKLLRNVCRARYLRAYQQIYKKAYLAGDVITAYFARYIVVLRLFRMSTAGPRIAKWGRAFSDRTNFVRLMTAAKLLASLPTRQRNRCDWLEVRQMAEFLQSRLQASLTRVVRGVWVLDAAPYQTLRFALLRCAMQRRYDLLTEDARTAAELLRQEERDRERRRKEAEEEARQQELERIRLQRLRESAMQTLARVLRSALCRRNTIACFSLVHRICDFLAQQRRYAAMQLSTAALARSVNGSASVLATQALLKRQLFEITTSRNAVLIAQAALRRGLHRRYRAALLLVPKFQRITPRAEHTRRKFLAACLQQYGVANKFRSRFREATRPFPWTPPPPRRAKSVNELFNLKPKIAFPPASVDDLAITTSKQPIRPRPPTAPARHSRFFRKGRPEDYEKEKGLSLPAIMYAQEELKTKLLQQLALQLYGISRRERTPLAGGAKFRRKIVPAAPLAHNWVISPRAPPKIPQQPQQPPLIKASPRREVHFAPVEPPRQSETELPKIAVLPPSKLRGRGSTMPPLSRILQETLDQIEHTHPHPHPHPPLASKQSLAGAAWRLRGSPLYDPPKEKSPSKMRRKK